MVGVQLMTNTIHTNVDTFYLERDGTHISGVKFNLFRDGGQPPISNEIKNEKTKYEFHLERDRTGNIQLWVSCHSNQHFTHVLGKNCKPPLGFTHICSVCLDSHDVDQVHIVIMT